MKVYFVGSILAIILAVPIVAPAAPARLKPLVLQQPDGAAFQAVKWGDENSHGWETLDGYTIIKEKSGGRWVYAVRTSTGALASTTVAVSESEPPQEAFHARPMPGRPKILSAVQARTIKRILGLMSASDLPGPLTQGSLPIVLATFSDTSWSVAPAAFTDILFNEDNPNSLKSYYSEVSYRQFTLTGEVSSWGRVEKTHGYYGGSRRDGDDDKGREFVLAALQKADAAGFDFGKYANDQCEVEVVGIVHQGYGQEDSGDPSDLWSHSWSLSEELTTNSICPNTNPPQYAKIKDYILMPEKVDGAGPTIGVYAHEYGHALGLPDLYDTDSSGSEGVGAWSLMGAGAWNGVDAMGNHLDTRFGNGNRPAHMDPWSKYALGWITPTQVIDSVENQPIIAASSHNADPAGLVYQFRGGSATSGEYFLVENRFRSGFDAGLPGEGLLIWHVDAGIDGYGENNKECWPGGKYPCSPYRHYKVALLQADNNWDLEKGFNRGDEGDSFPGATGNRSFGLDSYPNSRLYNGFYSGVAVKNISDPGETMTATLETGEPCTYTFSPAGVTFGAGGGIGRIAVTGVAGCQWDPLTEADWISITATTATDIHYTVRKNDDFEPRSGVIFVGEQFVVVEQKGDTAAVNLTVNDLAEGVLAETHFPYKTISGTVKAGATVTVTTPLREIPAYVDGTSWVATLGDYVVPALQLQEGENDFTVTADAGSNMSSIMGKVNYQPVTVPGVYPIMAEAVPGGTISPAGTITVAYGKSATFRIKPNPGYSLINLLVDGAPVGAKTTYSFRKISAAHSIRPTFQRKAFKISASAARGGIVAAVQPGAFFGDDASVTFTPLPGYRLSRLIVDGHAICGSKTVACTSFYHSYTLKVTKNHKVKAYFAAD